MIRTSIVCYLPVRTGQPPALPFQDRRYLEHTIQHTVAGNVSSETAQDRPSIRGISRLDVALLLAAQRPG